MKQIVLLLIAAGLAQGAAAQGAMQGAAQGLVQGATQGTAQQDGGAIATLSRELSRTEFYSDSSGARVDVIVTDDAKPALRGADTHTPRHSVTAYGVRLLSDSSQDGRANAGAAMDRFASIYPDVDVNMSYEIPEFWVTAGHFVDRLDAVALCGKVQSLFPRAFVVSMEVPIARIIARERSIPQSPAVPPPTAE